MRRLLRRPSRPLLRVPLVAGASGNAAQFLLPHPVCLLIWISLLRRVLIAGSSSPTVRKRQAYLGGNPCQAGVSPGHCCLIGAIVYPCSLSLPVFFVFVRYLPVPSLFFSAGSVVDSVRSPTLVFAMFLANPRVYCPDDETPKARLDVGPITYKVLDLGVSFDFLRMVFYQCNPGKRPTICVLDPACPTAVLPNFPPLKFV